MDLNLHVDDLALLEPTRFVTIGNAVVNPLSYHQAR